MNQCLNFEGSRVSCWWRNIRLQRVRLLTWLSPIAVVTMAEPKPVVTDTLIPPIILHTMMYHSILFLPYLWPPRERMGDHGKQLVSARGGVNVEKLEYGDAHRGAK